MTTDAPMFSTEEILWYDNGRWGEAGYAIANPNGKTWNNNGIYFVPFSHIYPYARYTLSLPPTTHTSCAWFYNRVYVDLTDTTIQASLVHADEVGGAIWESTTSPCAGFTNLSLTLGGHGNSQCNFDSATCVATSIS